MNEKVPIEANHVVIDLETIKRLHLLHTDENTLASDELESLDRIISYINYCTCRCLETRHNTTPIKVKGMKNVIKYTNCMDCLCLQYVFHTKKPYDPREETITSDDSIFGDEK